MLSAVRPLLSPPCRLRSLTTTATNTARPERRHTFDIVAPLLQLRTGLEVRTAFSDSLAGMTDQPKPAPSTSSPFSSQTASAVGAVPPRATPKRVRRLPTPGTPPIASTPIASTSSPIPPPRQAAGPSLQRTNDRREGAPVSTPAPQLAVPSRAPAPTSTPGKPQSAVQAVPLAAPLQQGRTPPPARPKANRNPRATPGLAAAGRTPPIFDAEDVKEERASASDGVDDERMFRALMRRRPSESELGQENLEAEIVRLYESQRATPAALRARATLVARLEQLFNSQRWFWGTSTRRTDQRRPKIKIQAFGSIRMGLSTNKSDLDLVILDPYRPNGYDSSLDANGKEAELYNMRSLATRLQLAGCMRVNAIPFAGVPIVKFEAIIDGELIQADINTNEQLGLYNSRLLNEYCELSPVVRPLAVFIKFWAKQRQLNDPSGSSGITSFSSYTLVLLLISYLQSLRLLPNLQDPELIERLHVERIRFFTRPRRVNGRKSRSAVMTGGVGCDVTFVEAKQYQASLPAAALAPLPSLVELAKGFFAYFADELDIDRAVVAISAGGTFARTGGRALPDPVQRVAQEGVDGGAGVPVTHETETVSTATLQDDDGKVSTLSPDEQLREAQEDLAMLALAEMDGRAPESFKPPAPPTLPGDVARFRQPDKWSQKLIVQDPFLLERNTAQNILDPMVDTLISEMRRAVVLIDQGASLAKICASITNEQAFQANSAFRSAERVRRNKDGSRAPRRDEPEGVKAARPAVDRERAAAKAVLVDAQRARATEIAEFRAVGEARAQVEQAKRDADYAAESLTPEGPAAQILRSKERRYAAGDLTAFDEVQPHPR